MGQVFGVLNDEIFSDEVSSCSESEASSVASSASGSDVSEAESTDVSVMEEQDAAYTSFPVIEQRKLSFPRFDTIVSLV